MIEIQAIVYKFERRKKHTFVSKVTVESMFWLGYENPKSKFVRGKGNCCSEDKDQTWIMQQQHQVKERRGTFLSAATDLGGFLGQLDNKLERDLPSVTLSSSPTAILSKKTTHLVAVWIRTTGRQTWGWIICCKALNARMPVGSADLANAMPNVKVGFRGVFERYRKHLTGPLIACTSPGLAWPVWWEVGELGWEVGGLASMVRLVPWEGGWARGCNCYQPHSSRSLPASNGFSPPARPRSSWAHGWNEHMDRTLHTSPTIFRPKNI